MGIPLVGFLPLAVAGRPTALGDCQGQAGVQGERAPWTSDPAAVIIKLPIILHRRKNPKGSKAGSLLKFAQNTKFGYLEWEMAIVKVFSMNCYLKLSSTFPAMFEGLGFRLPQTKAVSLHFCSQKSPRPKLLAHWIGQIGKLYISKSRRSIETILTLTLQRSSLPILRI